MEVETHKPDGQLSKYGIGQRGVQTMHHAGRHKKKSGRLEKRGLVYSHEDKPAESDQWRRIREKGKNMYGMFPSYRRCGKRHEAHKAVFQGLQRKETGKFLHRRRSSRIEVSNNLLQLLSGSGHHRLGKMKHTGKR